MKMKTNVFFKRIVIMVLSGVILTSILSAALYMAIARQVFVNIRADELLPVARTIASVVAEQGIDGATSTALLSVMRNDQMNFIDAEVTVTDKSGEIINAISDRNNGAGGPPKIDIPPVGTEDITQEDTSGGTTQGDFRPPMGGFPQSDAPPPEGPPPDAPLPEGPVFVSNVTRALNELVFSDVMTNGEVVTTARVKDSNLDYLVVAAPIIDTDGNFLGAVVITKRVDELSEKLDGLNITLIASAFLAFFIMLIPTYIAGKNLTDPIRNIQSVAQAMSLGDYSVRADEQVSGELGSLACSMNEFAEKSAKLEQTRRDYVANISHELRTPIASIRAMSETLRDGLIGDPDKQQRYYDHILVESLRLSRLVDDLLELSRLQSEGVAVLKERVDIMPTLVTASETFLQIASDADIDFKFNAPETLPLAYTNCDRVAQVLVTLLDNAMKHTPAGGHVILAVVAEDERLLVSVSDTGEGIPKEDLGRVFERFYKSDKSRATGGTGLGLSIAKEVLQMMGESIWAESEFGIGSIFSFTIGRL